MNLQKESKAGDYACNCLIILVVIIPILLTLFLLLVIFEDSYLGFIKSTLRNISRSPLYISLLAAILFAGITFFLWFLNRLVQD
jgi:hypothetical protein